MAGRRGGFALVVALVAAMAPASAERPRIAVVIDDMGHNRALDRRALNLPGPVGYAFLPDAPHTRSLAAAAGRQGKEVLLHQPMQAIQSDARQPDAIDLDQSEHQVRKRIARNLAAVPQAVGVNNHQGSLITQHPGHMSWVMETLRRRGDLFFLDSRTTPSTVGARMASEAGVPAIERDVFLDHERDRNAIEAQFDRLLATAWREGQAVAIGHPHPQTLEVLERRLAALDRRSVELVPISELATNSQEADASWHASSSP